MLGIFYKRDRKRSDDEIVEIKAEFKDFMGSQLIINQNNAEILTRLTTIQEFQEKHKK